MFNSNAFRSAALTLLFLAACQAHAADSKGQFAIRGAGLISCAIYIQEDSAKRDIYLITNAWVDGYVTGINQYAPDTYDLLSFETTELVMTVVDRYCHEHPKDPVFAVLNNLFKKLRQDRLREKSDKETIKFGGREAQHYVEVIRRMQRKLKKDGFYRGDISGAFNSQLTAAIKAFQLSIGYEGTGFPDQATLWRLLRKDE